MVKPLRECLLLKLESFCSTAKVMREFGYLGTPTHTWIATDNETCRDIHCFVASVDHRVVHYQKALSGLLD